MPRERNYTLLHAAAYHFAKISRKAAEIAKSVGVADKTIRQYAQDPEWERTLDIFGYTGIREFQRAPRRNVAREKGETYQRARDIYTQLLKDGASRGKLASLTAEAVDMPTRTIHRWATNANWQLEGEINVGNDEYSNIKLTRQIAKDIILEIYVRNSAKDKQIHRKEVLKKVSDYFRKQGGILPEGEKEMQGLILLGLNDVRYSGYAEKTNTEGIWLISPTKISDQ